MSIEEIQRMNQISTYTRGSKSYNSTISFIIRILVNFYLQLFDYLDQMYFACPEPKTGSGMCVLVLKTAHMKLLYIKSDHWSTLASIACSG